MRFIGAFESTYQPAFDIDVAESTAHTLRWHEDLELLAASGLRDVRYPIRWHRIERAPGEFDWTETDEVFAYLQSRGFRPIADLVHHTSYPLWTGGFGDPAFGLFLLRYVEAFARRYPEIEAYTLFNEPFTTFLLCGQQGIWPPFWRGIDGFIALARNIMPALTEASRRCRELLPQAQHVHMEACERASGEGAAGEAYAEMVNDRRFFLTDVFAGKDLSRDRPFVQELLAADAGDLLEIQPGHVDVLGLDYYAHNQWLWTGRGEGTTANPAPSPLAVLIEEYAERYGVPCIIGETNIRGFPSDRATWLKYTLEQCELARARGVDLQGYCWFPFVDSCDWDSILCRCDQSIDPVGVYRLDEDLNRCASSMSRSFRLAANGTTAAELPAYELQPPVAGWIQGWLPHMRDWRWRPAPPDEVDGIQPPEDYEIELRVVQRGV
jgi:beta-glucosidase/6-phospho-beta-glucosidase/beta-galactosidase